jgi:hypothetical protein
MDRWMGWDGSDSAWWREGEEEGETSRARQLEAVVLWAVLIGTFNWIPAPADM